MKANKIAQISVITASAIIVIALVYYGVNKKPKKLFNKKKSTQKKKGILLLGGLDYREGDKQIDEQVNLVKKDIDSNIDVKGYRYKDLSGILNAINENPDYSIMLFSAGAKRSKEVAQKVKEVNGDLNKLFIVEPYHKGGATTTSVREAVKMGVPEKNVFVGKYDYVGLGIVENPSSTPKCSPSHWCSLSEIGKLV